MNQNDLDQAQVQGQYKVTIRDSKGNIKYEDIAANKVTSVGIQHTLDVVLRNQTQTAQWSVGLYQNNLTPAITMTSSDIGTTAGVSVIEEFTSYTEAARQAYNPTAATLTNISNATQRAVFTCNGAATVYGMFLANNSTKAASTGLLFSVGSFATAATVQSGDTIEVTYTLTLTNQ